LFAVAISFFQGGKRADRVMVAPAPVSSFFSVHWPSSMAISLSRSRSSFRSVASSLYLGSSALSSVLPNQANRSYPWNVCMLISAPLRR